MRWWLKEAIMYVLKNFKRENKISQFILTHSWLEPKKKGGGGRGKAQCKDRCNVKIGTTIMA